MSLDEAINKLEDCAALNEQQSREVRYIGRDDWEIQSESYKNLAQYRRQLAEWLKELKSYKENGKVIYL